MTLASNIVALSQKQEVAVVEKSSVLTWERLIRSWLIILMVIAGISASIWGYYQQIEKEKARVAQAFETKALQQSNAVQSYLEGTLSTLKSVITDSQQGGKSVVGEDETQRLRISLKNMMTNQYVLRSAAWLPNDGSGQFRIRSLVYSPYYGARTDQITLGQDMTLMSSIQKAMSQALDKGHSSLAVLEMEKGVVALTPVYISNRQATRQQRSENLAGFVMAVIDMAAVIEVGLQRANLYDAVTQQTLVDVSQEGATVTLYAQDYRGQQDRAASPMSDAANMLSKDVDVSTGGVQWRLRFAAPYAAYGKAVPWSAWVVLMVGLLITGMISAFAASLTHSARVEKIVHERTSELKDAHEKVRESEMMLIQAEKLSSLGEMVAGVAHEINTPLGFIRCNLEMMDEQLIDMQMACGENMAEQADGSKDLLADFNMRMDDFASMVSETTHGIDRISEIVVSLKDFSRMDRLNFDEVDIHRCIDSTLNIAHNKIKHMAKVVKDYGQLPLVSCASGQINQVLLNIIVNAAQAIEGFGEIVISTRSQGDKVSIAIQDNGKGMSEATKQKVFQPFFTTKDVGKGTGLGLSICDKIIRQHSGEILIDSKEGVGTTFTIVLPVRNTLAKAA